MIIGFSGRSSGTGILDGTSGLTGAWSMGRRLVSSYGGSFYTATGGAVTTVFDQSGNSRDFNDGGNSGRRPAESTAGPNSRPVADFDGSTDFLIVGSGTATSTFITTSAGFIIASVIIDAYVTNNANSYQNDTIVQDTGGIVGLMARNTGGGTIYASNWDGNDDKAAGTLATATAAVLTWRHDTGTLYLTINGSETSVASGNSTTLVGDFQLGDGFGVNGNIKFFEMAVYNTVPDLTTRTALITDFKTYCGAV